MFTFPLNISYASSEKNNFWINRYTCFQFLITPAITVPFFPDKLKELSGLILYWPSFKSFVAVQSQLQQRLSRACPILAPTWSSFLSVKTDSCYICLFVCHNLLFGTFHHSVHLHDTADEGCFSTKILVTFSWHIICESITKEDSLLNIIHFSRAMYTCCLQLITWFITHLSKIQCVR